MESRFFWNDMGRTSEPYVFIRPLIFGRHWIFSFALNFLFSTLDLFKEEFYKLEHYLSLIEESNVVALFNLLNV